MQGSQDTTIEVIFQKLFNWNLAAWEDKEVLKLREGKSLQICNDKYKREIGLDILQALEIHKIEYPLRRFLEEERGKCKFKLLYEQLDNIYKILWRDKVDSTVNSVKSSVKSVGSDVESDNDVALGVKGYAGDNKESSNNNVADPPLDS